MQQDPLILIVGVCASGKTTLGQGLRSLGYKVRTFAQEHSASRRLWQRLDPDYLIVLECSYETVRRRKQVTWGVNRYRRQLWLLAHAKAHADLVHRHLVELGMGGQEHGS